MTLPRRTSLVVLAMLAVGTMAQAQSPPAPPAASAYIDERTGMGLDEAIARARDREPWLRAARADIEVARGQLQQAGLRANPTMIVERRVEPGGTDRVTSVGVEWPLELFRRGVRVRAAEREVEISQFTAADRERLLVADVRLRYGAAAAAVRDLVVADDLVAAARRQFDLLRARVDEGAAPPLERDLLDVDLRRLEAERTLAAGRADVAIVLLAQLLGMEPDQPLRLRHTLDELVAVRAAPSTSEGEAPIEARTDVREARARVALADTAVDRMRREGRIEVSVFATYMRMDAGFPQFGFDSAGALERIRGRFNYVAGGANIALPILNRNQGRVASALAERSAADHRREAVEIAARSDLVAARARDARARHTLALYESGMRALARQNLDVVRKTFDLGRATVFDLVAEQRRFLDVEQAYTAALREAWEARAALTRARGETP
jgi:outer membrane protein, heavy metal efflux system